MNNIIHLLPDSIANQIAAGEVIQRPASVVKELVENAVDAGASLIQVILRDAGRTLIQVIDDGKGMTEKDARMAFERHATSKIRTANDLFALHTLGFRGEALASIASVAQVELRTRRKEDATGTLLLIAGSQVEKQEEVAMSPGSNFAVKNLFFNIPARRKFLKSNETEFKNILTELERVALVYPQIAFNLRHNDAETLTLPPAGLKQRIVHIAGKRTGQHLLPVDIQTSFITISGFIGTPEASKQRNAAQYFFVNGRYIRHPYFHRAVLLAFEPFIPAGYQPNYFLYLTVDPASIDLNIHPTKTEVKFDDEPMLFQVITSAVKEAIAVPSLEFDQAEAFEIPVYTGPDPSAAPPRLSFRTDYNPFREGRAHKPPTDHWEKIYIGKTSPTDQPLLPPTEADAPREVLLYKDRYLLLALKSGLAIIDRRRAHIRVIYDDLIHRLARQQAATQQLIFPEIIHFPPAEAAVLPSLLEDLTLTGFDLADLGAGAYAINGIPAGLAPIDPVETLQQMVDRAIETGCEVREEIQEAFVLSLAQKAAIPYGKALSDTEAQALVASLFASSSPNYTPDGRVIISVLPDEDLAKRFKTSH